MVAAGVVLAISIAGMVWVLRSPSVTPTQQLVLALQMLKEGHNDQARQAAEKLEAEKYHDEEFPGGIEFILGICHFREASERPLTEATAQFATAIVYLREAERLGVLPEYEPESIHALGMSLYGTKSRGEALALLEVASHPENPRHIDAAMALTNLYLHPDWRNPERLQGAKKLNDLVLAAVKDRPEYSTALQQRAEVFLATDNLPGTRGVIQQLEKLPETAALRTVLEARVLIAEKRYVEAVNLLVPVAADETPDQAAPRQASYLMGLAAELQSTDQPNTMVTPAQRATAAAGRVEYRQRAVEYYRKTVNRFEGSEEAIASLAHLGRLQQEEGAYEKAIQSFGTVLRSVRDVEDYDNRWLPLEELRARTLEAWNRWIQEARYQEAIALADLMIPAFPRDQAYELAARARQRWAEQAEQRLAKLSSAERAAGEPELRRLWSDSADAFARLAQARHSAANFADAVWQSVELSYRGHDFSAALERIDEFLSATSEAMRPLALVRRGQILLDLDRIEEAEASFTEVRRQYPTNPAAFTAVYLLAVCRMERNDLDGADAQWRAILNSNELAPAAKEWQESLFSLAQLQGERATWSRRKLERPAMVRSESDTLWTDVASRSREAIDLFEQYVSRYPTQPQAIAAQYHLGKALQLQGDLWHRDWVNAETENARQQSLTQKQKYLERALRQFQQVRDVLTDQEKADELNSHNKEVLTNTWFEIPHTLFSLDRFQEAAAGYASAVHKFPQDVRVLTAYVQMAEAYARLDRPVEARSMLEQAKVMLDQEQIPSAAFNAPTTTLTRLEWEQWLDRARQVHRD